jgi:hypothetical protein
VKVPTDSGLGFMVDLDYIKSRTQDFERVASTS